MAVAALPGSGRAATSTTIFLAAGDWLLIVFGWAWAVALRGMGRPAASAGRTSTPPLAPPWCSGCTTPQSRGAYAEEAMGNALASYSIFATFRPVLPRFVGRSSMSQIVGTAFLVMLVVAVIDARNIRSSSNLGPLIIGFIVAAIGASSGANAGYAIDPARDFGPRLLAWVAGWGKVALPGTFRRGGLHFQQLWWYPSSGPWIGGVIGVVIYDLFIGDVLLPQKLADGSAARSRSLRDAPRSARSHAGGTASRWRRRRRSCQISSAPWMCGTTSTRFMIFDHSGTRRASVGLSTSRSCRRPLGGTQPSRVSGDVRRGHPDRAQRSGARPRTWPHSANHAEQLVVEPQNRPSLLQRHRIGRAPRPTTSPARWTATSAAASSGGRPAPRRTSRAVHEVLENIDGVREAAENGERHLRQHRLLGDLEPHRGPDGGSHVTDVTNASRTMLNLETLDWDGTTRVLQHPARDAAGDPAVRRATERFAGWLRSGACRSAATSVTHSRHRLGQVTAGRRSQEHLRHGQLHAAEHRRGTGAPTRRC